MRSPASRSREVHASPREDVAVPATNQQQEAIEEINAEDLNHKAGGETQTQQELERPPSRPLTGKRTWRTASQLANRGRRSSLQLPRQQQLDCECR
ncbi:unnamed protein product [Phytophthora lilii]|uniref:Unnamed protein product n=1 Tax=Phytophthora lilii TaxID=2077276 RepID=A0A9W6U9C0_9STRA|nr:unnamed protein product [Phytophthora lilii]